MCDQCKAKDEREEMEECANSGLRYGVGGFVRSGGNVRGGEFATLEEARERLREMPAIFAALVSASIWDYEIGEEIEEI